MLLLLDDKTATTQDINDGENTYLLALESKLGNFSVTVVITSQKYRKILPQK